jgi:hypothetical protein
VGCGILEINLIRERAGIYPVRRERGQFPHRVPDGSIALAGTCQAKDHPGKPKSGQAKILASKVPQKAEFTSRCYPAFVSCSPRSS